MHLWRSVLSDLVHVLCVDGVRYGVLMHPLALGAFCQLMERRDTMDATSLNAPFGARCFLTNDYPAFPVIDLTQS